LVLVVLVGLVVVVEVVVHNRLGDKLVHMLLGMGHHRLVVISYPYVLGRQQGRGQLRQRIQLFSSFLFLILHRT